MPRITYIRYNESSKRYWIYIDRQYCTSIRARTFPGMNLAVGQEITCDELNELEKFHWKNTYGQTAWKKEKIRIERVVELLKSIDKQIAVNIKGFGANTTALIKDHPDESGKPDLEVVLDNNRQHSIMSIEVTGTETKRGDGYWIRPDKLEYSRNHPDENVWVILHYSRPREQFVFIQPDNNKHYQHTEKTIRDSIEYYVSFNDASPETKTLSEFSNHLNALTTDAGI